MNYTPEQLSDLPVDELDRILLALNDDARGHEDALTRIRAQRELVRRARDGKLKRSV